MFSLPNRRKSAEKVEIPSAAVRISLPKQRKFSRKGRDSQVPQVAYLYPNSGNQPKRVEIPRATVRISLPKQRKSVEKVEIPRAIARISLPKQWKSVEKGRDSHSPRPHISTQTAKIGRRLCFHTVIFYKSCVYMIKYTH